MPTKIHALIIGANGMVATALTKKLINTKSVDKITLLSRRYIDINNDKVELKVITYYDLHKHWEFFSANVIFYCLGTTKSKTRKNDEFFKIAYQYCIDIAKISKHNKVANFIYLSCKGNSSKSLNHRKQVLGQLEEDLIEVGFPSLHILKPTTFFGKRDNPRFFESFKKIFLKMIDWINIGFLRSIKGMPVDTIAKYMIYLSETDKKGIFIHSNRQIHEFFSNRK